MGVQVDELRNQAYWNRQFIDFTFKGISATELGLVAVIGGDRYSEDLTAQFTDEVSEVNGVNGQYYWGTNYKARERTISMATDGITQDQLRRIKRWLQPGEYGRFEEYSMIGRHCYCRVSKPPVFKFIPFERKEEIFGEIISTTCYKGELDVTFVQDIPFTYANNYYVSPAITGQGPTYSKEQKYEIYNNRLVTQGKENESIWVGRGYWFGTDTYVEDGYLNISSGKTYNPSERDSEAIVSMKFNYSISNYSDTAPAYFNFINNDYYTANEGHPYNIITTGSIIKGNLKSYFYTLPDVFLSINQAIKIAFDFYKETPTGASAELMLRLRENITNKKVIQWAAMIIGAMASKRDSDNILFINQDGTFNTNTCNLYLINGTLNGGWFMYFNYMMLYMVADWAQEGEEEKYPDIRISGDFTGWFNDCEIIMNGNIGQSIMSYHYNLSGPSTCVKFPASEENCSDIMLSGYLKIEGGNNIKAVKVDDNIEMGTKKTIYEIESNGTYSFGAPAPSSHKIEYDYIFL